MFFDSRVLMSHDTATTELGKEYQTVPLRWKTSESTKFRIIGGIDHSTRMSINKAKTATLRFGVNTNG